MEIYLVRHGQSVANYNGIVQGRMDSPLTDLGVQQAKKLSKILPNHWDHIYLSPLKRAKNTGLIATGLDANDPKISYHDDLMEIDFGRLQGTPYDAVPYPKDSVRAHVEFREDIFSEEYGGENVHDFLHRTHMIFEHIVNEMQTNQWEKIIIFSHGGVLRSISQHYLKLSDRKWGNCEYGIARLIDENWKLDRFDDHI